jgi:hypothetical protein
MTAKERASLIEAIEQAQVLLDNVIVRLETTPPKTKKKKAKA